MLSYSNYSKKVFQHNRWVPTHLAIASGYVCHWNAVTDSVVLFCLLYTPDWDISENFIMDISVIRM